MGWLPVLLNKGGRLPKPACSLSGVAVDATNNRSEANMWHDWIDLARRSEESLMMLMEFRD